MEIPFRTNSQNNWIFNFQIVKWVKKSKFIENTICLMNFPSLENERNSHIIFNYTLSRHYHKLFSQTIESQERERKKTAILKIQMKLIIIRTYNIFSYLVPTKHKFTKQIY